MRSSVNAACGPRFGHKRLLPGAREGIGPEAAGWLVTGEVGERGARAPHARVSHRAGQSQWPEAPSRRPGRRLRDQARIRRRYPGRRLRRRPNRRRRARWCARVRGQAPGNGRCKRGSRPRRRPALSPRGARGPVRRARSRPVRPCRRYRPARPGSRGAAWRTTTKPVLLSSRTSALTITYIGNEPSRTSFMLSPPKG